MDLRQLRYFVAIAESESFSKAAVLLSVSQPVLSRQLGAVEQEFGVELFCRTGRGVVLTEPGQQLLAHARAVLENVRRMRSDMTAIRVSPIGNVIVGIPPMIGRVLTPQLVRDFCMAYPRISLHVMEGLSGQVYEWLTTGRVDVAILYNAPSTSTLIAEPILRDDLGLVGSAGTGGPEGSSVRMSELGEFPLIAPSRAHGLRAIVDSWATRNGVQLDIRVEIDSWQMTLDLVRAGMGYAVLPYTPVRDQVEAGQLRFWHLREPRMTGVLSLAASSQRPRTPATRHLMSSIRQHVRQMVKDGRWNQEDVPPPPLPNATDRQPVSRIVGELRTH